MHSRRANAALRLQYVCRKSYGVCLVTMVITLHLLGCTSAEGPMEPGAEEGVVTLSERIVEDTAHNVRSAARFVGAASYHAAP